MYRPKSFFESADRALHTRICTLYQKQRDRDDCVVDLNAAVVREFRAEKVS
jgi:hypothetical protein